MDQDNPSPAPSPTPGPTRVAVACQGGGSQAAFAAGALTAVLTHPGFGTDYHLVGLSGTSGGAICALLTWYGLLEHGGAPDQGVRVAEAVHRFWADNSAHDWWDVLANQYVVAFRRLQDAGVIGQPPIPRAVQAYTQERLRELIERHVDFAALPALLRRRPAHPVLLFGAVEVLSGDFVVFQECCPDPSWRRRELGDVPPSMSVSTVLASAAVPPFLPAVPIGQARYWDGLYAYNPPLRSLLDRDTPDERPDEIWVVQIDPQRRRREPVTLTDVADRKFELSSNLSMAGEIHWIKQVNQWLDQGKLSRAEFKPVRVARIGMGRALQERYRMASKADRSVTHMQDLVADGQRQMGRFLTRRAEGGGQEWFEPLYPERYRTAVGPTGRAGPAASLSQA